MSVVHCIAGGERHPDPRQPPVQADQARGGAQDRRGGHCGGPQVLGNNDGRPAPYHTVLAPGDHAY